MSCRFKAGDAVAVKTEHRPGHVRTPAYIRGKKGVIAALNGHWKNPEQLAYGLDGYPLIPLYGVEFDLAHVWDDPSLEGKLYVDIFEHWLELA